MSRSVTLSMVVDGGTLRMLAWEDRIGVVCCSAVYFVSGVAGATSSSYENVKRKHPYMKKRELFYVPSCVRRQLLLSTYAWSTYKRGAGGSHRRRRDGCCHPSYSATGVNIDKSLCNTDTYDGGHGGAAAVS